MKREKRMLVVSSHALDFLWRAGGTIATYAKMGWDIKVLVLSYGERGESDALWENNPGITEEEVKALRRQDSEEVCKKLGVSSVQFFDWGDHLLVIDRDQVLEIAKIIKEYRPGIILTQFKEDTLNFDHPETLNAVLKAVRCSRVAGVHPELKKHPMPDIFMYDPAQPEFFGFKPDTFIDITDMIDAKVEAMQVAAKSQGYLIDTYKARAAYRGTNARMFCGDKSVKYAEAFVRFSPYVGKEFF